jgi:hypothetical protein
MDLVVVRMRVCRKTAATLSATVWKIATIARKIALAAPAAVTVGIALKTYVTATATP